MTCARRSRFGATHVLAAILLVCASTAAADTLHGTLVDRATRAPVAGAVIQVGDQLAASDDAGMFALELPAGSYDLQITAGVHTVTQRAVVRGEVTLVIELDASETIEVVDIAPTELGQTKVEAKFARSVPGGGDAAKIVQSLPSVARTAAGSAEIVVWGAAPNDTRTFVDGVPVPALYHVGGYRAATGNDLIGSIGLTPAAFGVDRGGAIGGVIDIAMADPADAPRWRLQTDVLDISEAARWKLGAATFAFAFRKSWLDQEIDLISDPATLAPNTPLPKWEDGQLVMRLPLAEHVVLTAWTLFSRDLLARTLHSDDPATITEQDTSRLVVRSQVTVRHDRDDGYDAATLWGGRDHARDDYQFGLVPALQDEIDWVAGGRAVQQRRLGEHATLTAGLDVDGQAATLTRNGSLSIPAREGDLHIFGQPPGDDVAADHWQATTVDAAAHGALDLRLGPVSATLGLRADAWLLAASRLTPRIGTTPELGSQQLIVTPDPRGSVSIALSDETALHVDGGRYHQARAASDTSAVFGTPDLGVERAYHLTAGAQWRRSPLAIELVGYARWLDELTVRDSALTPKYAMALIPFGTGEVYGVQLTARVLHWHGLSGWLSYNLSRSMREDAGQERYFDHDQTHGLIAVAGWERGPWSIGGRVRYATGEPRTDVVGAFFDSRSGRYQPIVGPHNGVRLPAYFAADARGERRFTLGKTVKAAVYLELQNLTDRANAEEIIYSADFTQKGYLQSLPLLAIAGLRFER